MGATSTPGHADTTTTPAAASGADPAEPRTLREAAPGGMRLLFFQTFNAASFQIALNTPAITLALFWGASEFYIGMLSALVPLLTTLQFYMGPRVEYIGFRRVMVLGWTARTLVLTGAAVLPFVADRLPNSVLLAALFCAMFAFNFVRGLATASWLPWLSYLVPAGWRGRFISAEQFRINLTSVVVMFVCGWVLGEQATNLRYGILYVIAVVSGWMAVFILRTVPAPEPKPGRPRPEPLWVWARAVWRHRPVRRLIRLNAIAAFVNHFSLPAFATVFACNELALGEGTVVMLGAATTGGILLSVRMWGYLVDRFGSRPVMALASWVQLVVLACFLMLSLRLMPGSPPIVGAVMALMGMSLVGQGIANARYSMNNVPEERRVLALTLFSACSSLMGGVAPMFWGLFLDVSSGLSLMVGPFMIDEFSVFFILLIGLVLVCKVLMQLLPETTAAERHVVVYHLFADYPLHTLSQAARWFDDRRGRGAPSRREKT